MFLYPVKLEKFNITRLSICSPVTMYHKHVKPSFYLHPTSDLSFIYSYFPDFSLSANRIQNAQNTNKAIKNHVKYRLRKKTKLYVDVETGKLN